METIKVILACVFVAFIILIVVMKNVGLLEPDEKDTRSSSGIITHVDPEYDYKDDVEMIEIATNPFVFSLACVRLREGGHVGRKSVREVLVDAAKHHDNPSMRAAAIGALADSTRDEDVRNVLATAIEDNNDEVRAAARAVVSKME